MKISYKDIVRNLKDKPTIEKISSRLYQLGHENEYDNDILDIEITPNRGDCLSLNGILRELGIFYEINRDFEIYQDSIHNLELDFENNDIDVCPKISFLKIEIKDLVTEYKDYLENYFKELSHKKINFFTDVSNYLSYETGQPTHCYDYKKINGKLSLEKNTSDVSFETLHKQKLNLLGNNSDSLFFLDDEVINFAGVMGGIKTACSTKTQTALVECAFFEPEAIIGKSIKYDLQSDAAYKFERCVDHNCHESVLRRFIKIIKDHTEIVTLEMKTYNFKDIEQKCIEFDSAKIDQIVGYKTSVLEKEIFLKKLGFMYEKNMLKIPTFRTDINHLNDIAEEIARVIGYDNIPIKPFEIMNQNDKFDHSKEDLIKTFLINKGFYDVINFPFTDNKVKDSITIDNPIDSNKSFMRTTLKDSLVENILFNERRQKDSIKIFEISDIYSNKKNKQTVIGVIASGRLGKNYKEFSKKIDKNYFNDLLNNFNLKEKINIVEIKRDKLDTKIKHPIFYVEINIDNIQINNIAMDSIVINRDFVKYKEISDYPSTYRDISYAVKNPTMISELEKYFKNFENNKVKDIFIFDYYNNEKLGVVKIGYRLIFQSCEKTLTDLEVDEIISEIIGNTLNIESVEIPGLENVSN